MYGKVRSPSSRLLNVINRLDESFYVETNLDWVIGERIAITATGLKSHEFEEFNITDYNPSTGLLTISGKA